MGVRTKVFRGSDKASTMLNESATMLSVITAAVAEEMAHAFHEYLTDTLESAPNLFSIEMLDPSFQEWGEENGIPTTLDETKAMLINGLSLAITDEAAFVGYDGIEDEEAYVMANLNEYGRADVGVPMARTITDAVVNFLPKAEEILIKHLGEVSFG